MPDNSFKKLDPVKLILSGQNLIEASAGTGKTYTISTLLIRLIVENDLDIKNILIVTFTEAATAELKERIRARLKEVLHALEHLDSQDKTLNALINMWQKDFPDAKSSLELALYSFDEAAIYTIHGFCSKVLKDNAFESGMPFETDLLTDQQSLLEEICKDFWAENIYDARKSLVTLLTSKTKFRIQAKKQTYLPSPSVSVSSLTKTLTEAFQHAEIRILNAGGSFNIDPDKFVEAYKEAREIWHHQKDDVINLLINSLKSLHGVQYKLVYFGKWSKVVDQFFYQTMPGSLILPDQLIVFSSYLLEIKTKKNCSTPRHRFFDVVNKLWDLSLDFKDVAVNFRLALIKYAKKKLDKIKRENSLNSYNDLLTLVDLALSKKGSSKLAQDLRETYQAALIDEFQDTDSVQYRIFNKIYKNSNLPFFLIGDPKQSIYSFRGADIFAYSRAIKNVKNKNLPIYTLDTNWRSDPGLISAVNQLFANPKIPNPFLLENVQFAAVAARKDASDLFMLNNKKTAGLNFRFVPRVDGTKKPYKIDEMDAQLGKLVAGDILQLIEPGRKYSIDGRQIIPGDICILVRSNTQAVNMQNVLRGYQIPSITSTRSSVYLSLDANELHILLVAILNTSDKKSLRAALVLDIIGLDAFEVFDLDSNEDEWQKWIMRFREWKNVWKQSGFIQMFHQIINQKTRDDTKSSYLNLLKMSDGERRMTNLLHLSELLSEAYLKTRMSPASLLKWFEQQISESGDMQENAELRLESDRHAVKIMTIHKSKGLEFPVVFCPYLWNGKGLKDTQAMVFHDDETDSRTFVLNPNDEQKELKSRENFAESMRLLYVALTRAKHAVFIAWANVGSFNLSALSYLLHQDLKQSTWPELSGYIKTLSDEQIINDLDFIASKSEKNIQITEFENSEPLAFSPDITDSETLEAKKQKRHLIHNYKTSSFSSLVYKAGHATKSEDIKRDLDDFKTDNPAFGETAKVKNDPVLLVDFAKGANAGNFFHSVFEEIDFADRNSSRLKEIIKAKLSVYGLSQKYGSMLDLLEQSFIDILNTPLDKSMSELRLSEITCDKRLNEFEFIFPLLNSEKKRSRQLFTSGKLASLIKKHQPGMFSAEYLSQIGNLDFAAFNGFLKGFIDLTFEYQGKFYIADYKSNFLGEFYSDYDQPALQKAMYEHHYYLQYLLYTVALHKYLKLRLSDYDYDKHFGSVFYLFIRGMSPNNKSDFGIFSDRLSFELINELDLFFASKGEEK